MDDYVIQSYETRIRACYRARALNDADFVGLRCIVRMLYGLNFGLLSANGSSTRKFRSSSKEASKQSEKFKQLQLSGDKVIARVITKSNMQRSVYAKALGILDMVPAPNYGYIWYRRRNQAGATDLFVDLGQQPVY